MLTIFWDNRFLRFLLVGALNTAFGYSVFALFIYAGLHYSLAAFLGTAVGVMFNFKSTGRIVFGNRDDRRIFRFVAVYGVVYLVNVLALKLLAAAGMNLYAAGAVLLLPLAALSFFLNKTLVFQGER
ncbi:MAG: GtrA family protein [Elusimicrobia bacterium]|nr:GtrA family protein [Elusimicrobiota bacterium]MDA8243431.1 GtrA family protein [Elusimicrobiota bacterium]